MSGTPGITFSVVIWLLGALAAAQVIAVIWKVVPATIVRVATTPPRVVEESSMPTEPFRPAAEPAPPPQPAQPDQDPQLMQEAMLMAAQAESAIRVGDWEKAQSILLKALEILPRNPALEYQYAFVVERMGREMESSEILASILARPDLDPQLRADVSRLKTRVDQTIENLRATGLLEERDPSAAARSPLLADSPSRDSAGPVLDSIGLQPGADLGIVEAKEVDTEEAAKKLRVAIKSRPGAEIARDDVKLTIRFFEQGPDGEIFLTQAPVTTQWISQPVDWADNEPEILDVLYPLPTEETTKFHGYTVAIYYRSELQDTRAVPGNLDQQFPHDLFLDDSVP